MTEASHRRPFEGLRVIVAEDDPDMRTLLADILRRDGCVVREAHEGGHLMAILQMDPSGAPADIADLLITDVRMPSANGLVILASLRRAGWTVPVIAMSAFSDGSVRTEAERLGAFLLDKPFRLETLRDLVRGLFGSTSPGGSADGSIRAGGSFRRG